MRDIIQKSSDTDKQIAIAFRRSVWLSYLLSLTTISVGGLSIVSVALILGIKPAQADITEQSALLADHTAEEEPASQVNQQETLTRSEVFTQAEKLAFHPQGAVLVPMKLDTGDKQDKISQTSSLQTLAASSLKITADNNNLQAQFTTEDELTTDLHARTTSSTAASLVMNSVDEGRLSEAEGIREYSDGDSELLAVGKEPAAVTQTVVPSVTEFSPTINKGPGGASLLGQDLQAQSTVEDKDTSSLPETTLQSPDPLAPTLRFQGVFLNQGDSSARARLTGTYPISPNAMFGGTIDLTTGNDFSDSPGGGLELNELYFTGSLPKLPNLRLSVGLLDLTSYFDRNSFAKDGTTHFFNPVFQTNPALSAAGIGSRPAVLLNWNVTDNIEAKAAAFSSYRNLGDLSIDGFAGEIGLRAGNGIIRGTFASNRDAGQKTGFEEIYGIPRGDDDFGLRSSDRENSYGINGEYFIPQLNLGLFGRYGHYENTAVDEGGDTYSLGLNVLDLFMQDDRLGFGYGRKLSNSERRDEDDDKVPDVWELFYDFRVSPYLRAGVTLQARDEFSDVVAGFRVKTEFDLTSLGRLFR